MDAVPTELIKMNTLPDFAASFSNVLLDLFSHNAAIHTLQDKNRFHCGCKAMIICYENIAL